jgi:hypothetical protein
VKREEERSFRSEELIQAKQFQSKARSSFRSEELNKKHTVDRQERVFLKEMNSSKEMSLLRSIEFVQVKDIQSKARSSFES